MPLLSNIRSVQREEVKRTKFPRKTVRAVDHHLPDTDLPETWVPNALRLYEDQRISPRGTMYACGYQGDERKNEFGMFWGPMPDLEAALDVVPGLFDGEEVRNRKACILRFNSNGTDEVLYEWSEARQLWRRVGR